MTVILKPFRVAQIAGQSREGDLFVHLLLARDGECWEVLRRRSAPDYPAWPLHEQIEVPMRLAITASGDRSVVPNWELLECLNPVKFDLHTPYEAVATIWGREAAGAFFTPTAAPTPARRRRSRRLLFSPEHFTSDAICTVEEKADAANRFAQFATRGFRLYHFTRALYFAVAAAFDLDPLASHAAFFETWFGSARRRLQFVQHVANCAVISAPMQDLAVALQAFVIQRVLRPVSRAFQDEHAAEEQRILRELLRKHGLPSEWRLPHQTALDDPFRAKRQRRKA